MIRRAIIISNTMSERSKIVLKLLLRSLESYGYQINCLVEGNGGTQQTVDHVRVVVKLLVYHEGQDTHLGGTAVVELHGLAAVLSDGRVGGAASLLNLALARAKAQLKKANEGKKLSSASGRDHIEGLEASGDLGKLEAVGNLTRKAHTCSSHEVTEDGKHGDAAMLGLDIA